MSFSTRNAYYLRVSNYRVIPLFLYLDERHVDWMTDRVLQLVIGSLQTKMFDLLQTARAQKKHKVYVERGEGYQFCYFLRSTTRTEVVLLKQKTYSLRAPTPEPTPQPLPTGRNAKTPRMTPSPRRPSSRARASTRGRSETPLQQLDEAPVPQNQSSSESDEEKEINIKDWKPSVDVTYKGFGTSSLQLVLIIEPYPPLPPSQYAPPSSRLSSRSSSIVSSYSRSRTKGTGARTGTGAGGRYSSVSLSLNEPAAPVQPERNMRNATRSVSTTPVPNSRNGGSVTPFGREGTADSSTYGFGRRRQSGTPLFMARDTPFGDDEEDEEEHEAYEAALREGRLRLPSVTRPASEELQKRKKRHHDLAEEEEDDEDIPDSMRRIGERLVRSSEIEEGVLRIQAGWEERLAGEESAVLGKEEPGD